MPAHTSYTAVHVAQIVDATAAGQALLLLANPANQSVLIINDDGSPTLIEGISDSKTPPVSVTTTAGVVTGLT